MNIAETDRLVLRRLCADDAGFILGLLNEPSFIEFVGDRGVRTLDEARSYILERLVASYDRFGFGLYLVVLKEGGAPIGICGFVQRDWLEEPDVGFALLPQFWSRGYARESAAAVMEYGRRELGLDRVLAITTAHNRASMEVLRRIGLRFEATVRNGDEELTLFASSPPAAASSGPAAGASGGMAR